MHGQRSHPESVSVGISGCSKDDARIVFDALCGSFASDRRAEDVPEELSDTRPTVWLGTFDVSEPAKGVSPAPLSSSVIADLQGGYWAIDRFRTTLDALFSVQDLSTASGDQETELHVRLETR